MKRKSKDKILEFIKKFPFFVRFSEQELKKIIDCSQLKTYDTGEIIVQEGIALSSLGFIVSGVANVTKQYKKSRLDEDELLIDDNNHQIHQLKTGDIFGEMSFIADELTSASISAAEPTEVLFISKEQILSKERGLMSAYHLIVGDISKLLVARLKQTNQKFTHALHTNLIHEKIRVNAGKLIVLIIFATGVNNCADLIVRSFHLNPDNRLVVWGMLILFALPSFYVLNNSNYSKADVGLDFTNWRPTLKRALIISMILSLLFAVFKYLVLKTGVLVITAPFFNIQKWLNIEPYHLVPILYFFSSGIQEFMMRGLLQGGVHRLIGQQYGLLSVFITAFYFAVLHFHFGVMSILLVFSGGIFFGLIYLKDKNILGVTIVHYVLGALITSFGLM